ncbi:putative tetratricopeptide-like helical domain, pre-mRNA-processing factor 6/Prp1/STA1 [Medicago truncatula]|uniref:Putative tetratricopeptide-like helical domain, pre-mRNA-processing factor 6/Prp1/STA1 n=1 Tax=Medicago truncatula TaxID=3880 RepID=A0A396IM24_MEDTR|nr:putative tetratricopeptide-like helical domain, pre-mRNA-processing factor 6/Prp1/STA1 [Medicago truncatula]
MVFVVPPTGKILSLYINPNTTTLHNLKLLIEQFHGISIEQQRIFLSQSLPLLGHNDSVLISDLGVGNYSTITLHVPFYGGTQPPAIPKLPCFDFHNSNPPAKYVAGLGCGSTGLFASGEDDKKLMLLPHQTQTEVVWLKDAKEKWLAGDVPAARAILQQAYAAIPNSEAIWLAAFKLEFENQELERARMLLAIVERELGNIEVDEGLKQFPSFYKLWLMLGQLEEGLAEAAKQQDQPEKRHAHLMEAKNVYNSGLKRFPNSVPLWLSLANIEEEMSDEFSKVRAVLTIARKKNPQNPELWLAAVRAELRHGCKKEADYLMAKSLQECPNSGILLAEYSKH